MITTRLWHALKDVSIYDSVYRRAVSPEKLPMRRSLPLVLRLGLVAVLFSAFCGGISLAPDLAWGILFALLVGFIVRDELPLVFDDVLSLRDGFRGEDTVPMDG